MLGGKREEEEEERSVDLKERGHRDERQPDELKRQKEKDAIGNNKSRRGIELPLP